ncbi:hypothetical protein EDB81DRAFT_791628 [Dactylonectria macrodidyma]|uniref:Uncharacterized protein n=1 Tax=Dactylonectria macrodidyma TaxID=307937 RepID=A0A9P9F792_9HYPO|nr:hypothetical protein EDB81DRAFT_791628 [Dactylonectria macrodidyma]
MAHLTESDILAALDSYRAHIGEVSHRAMSTMIPAIEAACEEDPGIAEEMSEEEVEECRILYLELILGFDRSETQPPIERPSDILTHWDAIAEQVTLNGTMVHADTERRATKREMYRSAILDGLGRFECPTGQWAFPPDLEILIQHVDSLEGHGWYQLRDRGGLVFWVGWGSVGALETYERVQRRVMSRQDILAEALLSDLARDKYEMAGGWRCGTAVKSCVYVVYSRPRSTDTEDKNQGWSWRYIACFGGSGDYIFDDIVAVLDWLKHLDGPDEQAIEVYAEDVFAV